MRPLQQLPVWVVIRLCTNEDRMVEYWNSIDSVIELNMDVIDDPQGEATEIHRSVRTILLFYVLYRGQDFFIFIHPTSNHETIPSVTSLLIERTAG
jgi:hypothetical protein